MTALPEGWELKEASSILTFEYGKSLAAKKRSGSGFPVYGSNGVIGFHKDFLVSGPGIVVGRKGSFGEINWVDQNFFPIDTTYYIKGKGKTQIRFIYYLLQTLGLKSLNRSTAIPGLNRNDAYVKTIALPPKPEQEEIVRRLDALMGQHRQLQKRLQAFPQWLKDFRQSVLHQAVKGKLTEKWRDEEVTSWATDRIENCIISMDQGWSPKCLPFPTKSKDKWGVIKTTSVQCLNFQEDENKQLPEHLAFKANLKVEAGDVLITRAGPRVRVGVCCLVKEIGLNLMICDKVYRVRVDQDIILPDFLQILINSPEYVQKIDKLKTGISDSGVNLTQSKVKAIEFEKPEIQEQQEIVRRVEKLLELADQLEARYQRLQAAVNDLPQALLQKAFSGELTKEWRQGQKGEEPVGDRVSLAAE